MIRISIPYAYELAKALQPLSSLTVGAKLSDIYWMLYGAEFRLNEFVGTSVYAGALKATQAPAQQLLTAIKKLTALSGTLGATGGIINAPESRTLDYMDAWTITHGLQQFETVLSAELNVADCYLVTQKGGYDTLTLIQNAQQLFPSELTAKAPGAIPDVRAAGTALAYELGSACGFHLLRALEAVLRQYYDVAMKGKARPKNRNLGGYLKKLEDEKAGNPKVIATLQQIRDLHRNPLMHPEDILTTDDAIALFGIVRSAVTEMLKALPVKPPNTPLPIASSALASLKEQPS
jgi:hypothetical protein